MAELIRSLRWDHAKKSLNIFAHLILFFWIVTLVMHTKNMNNNTLYIHYLGIALYTLSLFRFNQNILKD